MIGNTSADYGLYTLSNGGAEQHMEEWWDAMCRSTKRLMEHAPIEPGQIDGISFCSQMQGLVLVDETGARPYEFSNAVPPAHEVAECRVEAGKERAQVRFVLTSAGWGGRSDRRPEWLQVMSDGATERVPAPHAPLWPDRAFPADDWRLNLDPLRGRLFGRLLGWRARACAEKAL